MFLKLSVVPLVVLWCFLPQGAAAGTACVTRDGLEVCVQPKGPVDLYHLLPRETAEIQMDMFWVTISNRSDRRVRIDPANFAGVTEKGQTVRLDVPLFQSIELRTKLRRADLGPGERLEGHLFFPSYMGRLQAIAYQSRPYIQVKLY